MLVKCSWCEKNFNSERYGRQFCPHCGAELDLPAPGAHEAVPAPRTLRPGEGEGGAPGEQRPASPGATMLDPWAQPGPTPQQGPAGNAPPQGQWNAGQGGWGPPPGGGGVPPQGPWGTPPGGGYPPGGGQPPGDLPQDEDAPWERRSQLGFFPALVETWKQATLDPKRFFARLKTNDIGEAFLYGWILSTLGTLLSAAWNIPVAMFTGEDMTLAAGQIIAAPILSAIGLFIGAAFVHIGCMIFGCAGRGFDATFRTVAYAQGPQLLAFVPFIGPLVASIWATVITIQGIAAMQRTTTGKATGAVLLPGLAILLCCGCGLIFAFSSIMAAMEGFGGQF